MCHTHTHTHSHLNTQHLSYHPQPTSSPPPPPPPHSRMPTLLSSTTSTSYPSKTHVSSPIPFLLSPPDRRRDYRAQSREFNNQEVRRCQRISRFTTNNPNQGRNTSFEWIPILKGGRRASVQRGNLGVSSFDQAILPTLSTRNEDT